MSGCVAIFAGTTGKIAGSVIDQETKQPLPGVNVMVVGTGFGAVTSLDGSYTILNIPPGTYEVKYSLLGYAEVRIQKVRVEIDLTTELLAQMKQEAIEGEHVVIVAERPVVTRDMSNSQMSIESKTIDAMPVMNITQVMGLQAGIERGREGIIVRGGGANQTAFMLDGFSLNDERANIPYTAVGLSSVKEVQIQTGGFNAEYGNLRSGLVNVITREGSTQRYSATALLRYNPPGKKHFGRSLYDPYSYFNRVYMDPDVCYVGTQNGPWDEYTRSQYPSFDGWIKYSEQTLQDEDPSNDVTAEGAKRIYEWQHRRQGDIKEPDYIADLGLGGPIPFVGKKLGNLRFFSSHYREKEMFIFPLSRDGYSENHTQLKLTSDLSPNIKAIFTGLYGEVYSVSPYNWTTTPTGRVLRDQSEIADLLSATEGRAILYMPGYYSPTDIYRQVYGVQVTHMISPRTFYEVFLQYNLNRYKTFKTADRDTTKKYEPIPGYFVDEMPYGYYPDSSPSINGDRFGAWMNLGRDRSVNATTQFKVDFTSQMHSRHQIKTGIQLVYNDFNIKSSTYSPVFNGWTREMFYRVFPYRFGVYVQDKIEFEGFIANLGLRVDYSDPNGNYLVLDEFDKNLSAGYGQMVEKVVEKKKAKGDLYWSPRLGVSHPITENSKLYFNYGHFTQEPNSSYRFRLQRESNGTVTYLGNPNMKLEKTIAYELGYSQNLFNEFLLNVAAYYKDVTNQPGWINYININSMVNYYKAANNNYADIRGFEVTLTKMAGRWLSGFINYTYHVSTSGYFGLLRYYQDPTQQRYYLRQNIYQEKPQPQPFVRANIDLHTPERFGPSWHGFYPLADWSANILANWREGAYTTYNPNNIPGVLNNVQWRDYYNIDLRLSKQIAFHGLQVQLYCDISNLLNVKYLNYASFADAYDYEFYMKSLNFSWEEGEEKGNDRIGDYRPANVKYDPLELNPNNDPEITARNKERKRKKSYIDNPNIDSLMFLNPRDIIFGVRINF